MAEIVLKKLEKKYDNGFCAVKDFNLEIEDKEFIIFVGPSGCGKSTTLRMIAGLEEITDGELWIKDKLVNFTDAKERDLSMVFQSYALYPNMTVYENIAFSLRVRKVNKKEIDEKVKKVAEMLGLTPFLKNRPKDLSGGQKQRVAIGSAIIRDPSILLMDEPLSNLDAKLRGQMRVELANLHKELGNIIIYVTHDQTEAMTLGTRIVVMDRGLVQQVDTPSDLYRNPVNLFVATFIGSPAMNLATGKITYENKEKRAFVNVFNHKFKLSNRMSKALDEQNDIDKDVMVGIRPEYFYDKTRMEKCVGHEEWMENTIEVMITHRELLGNDVLLYFEYQGKTYVVKADASNQAQPGDLETLWISIDEACMFDLRTDRNIFYEMRKPADKKEWK